MVKGWLRLGLGLGLEWLRLGLGLEMVKVRVGVVKVRVKVGVRDKVRVGVKLRLG